MTSAFLIWLLFGICLALSFLLSGMEAGVFALSRLRIRQQMRAGRRSAGVLYQYLEHPENFLWTILVGNTLANFYILGLLIAVLESQFRNQRIGFILVYGMVVLVFYSFFDLLPKMLFRMYPNRLCMFLAPPFRFVHLTMRPLVWLVRSVSSLLLRLRGGKVFTGHLFGNREELRVVMQESAQSFSSEEQRMINRVLDLQTLTVRQVMKPISLAGTLVADNTAAEALAVCRARKHSRMPVWDKASGPRRVVGLLNVDVLLYQTNLDPTQKLSEFVQPALYMEEDLRLEVALRRMQKGGQRLAIVLGRDRREVGLLSLQDVLKVIFGEVSL
jgi:CBS domain containing-hemolysin-like protein